MKLFTFSKI